MNIRELLKQHDLKVTKPRKAILEILSLSEHGLDAETIREEVKRRDLYINLSTVYRTLDLLESINVLDKYDLGDNKNNYVLKRDQHIHTMTCEMCDKTVDLDCPMVKIEELISRETGFSIKEHHLELKGICAECSKLKQAQKDKELVGLNKIKEF